MNSPLRTTDILILTGLVIGIVGCFLPWAEFRWSFNQFLAYSEIKTGAQLSLGIISFFGCTLAVFFHLVYQARKKVRFTLPTLLGTFVAMSCSGTWISEPGAFEHSHGLYTALYGAAVTLAGSVIASATIILFFTVVAERNALFAQNTAKN